MSTPLFIGNMKLPSFSIDKATTASRGSPFVLNSVSPRHTINDNTHTPMTIMVCLLLTFITIAA